MAAHAYEKAYGVLDEVPPPLRGDEHKQLLAEADTKRKEVLALSGDVREALKAKQTDELMPKLERLLQLRPDHEQALELAQNLRDKLCRGSRDEENEPTIDKEVQQLLTEFAEMLNELLQERVVEGHFGDFVRIAATVDSAAPRRADRPSSKRGSQTSLPELRSPAITWLGISRTGPIKQLAVKEGIDVLILFNVQANQLSNRDWSADTTVEVIDIWADALLYELNEAYQRLLGDPLGEAFSKSTDDEVPNVLAKWLPKKY